MSPSTGTCYKTSVRSWIQFERNNSSSFCNIFDKKTIRYWKLGERIVLMAKTLLCRSLQYRTFSTKLLVSLNVSSFANSRNLCRKNISTLKFCFRETKICFWTFSLTVCFSKCCLRKRGNVMETFYKTMFLPLTDAEIPLPTLFPGSSRRSKWRLEEDPSKQQITCP